MTDTSPKASALGAFYTPPVLARWAAGLLAELLPEPGARVLDPACGDGALLAAAGARCPALRLLGLEIDARAAAAAAARLPGAVIHREDAISWLARAPQLADGVITNPPWGAALSQRREALSALGYTLSSGQFNSWDLFVEGALWVTRPGGALVFILPDAVLLPEHAPARRLLVSRTQLRLVARLGEGFFEGVYRGVVVIAALNTPPEAQTLTRCLRLPPDWRQRVLAGEVSLDRASAALSHQVPQARFAGNPGCAFDLDLRQDERDYMTHIERAGRTPGAPWSRLVTSGRGVELARSGKVARCPRCGTARPWPRGVRPLSCRACGLDFQPERPERIVYPLEGAPGEGWAALITGADVDRHRCAPSSRIRLGVPGIQYKRPGDFAGPKLLVRKTGVGIKAAVDRSGALTTQVVLHIRPRPVGPRWLLDYLQGVLCSRVMMAWHLKRQGENEWRSHPYLTQRLLLSFPVPDPLARPDRARAVAAAVAARRAEGRHDGPADRLLERRVAELLGLGPAGVAWALQVLEEAQPLEPIRTLRLPSAEAVFPAGER